MLKGNNSQFQIACFEHFQLQFLMVIVQNSSLLTLFTLKILQISPHLDDLNKDFQNVNSIIFVGIVLSLCVISPLAKKYVLRNTYS